MPETCPECGADMTWQWLTDYSHICPKCGFKTWEASNPPRIPTCPECGKNLTYHDTFYPRLKNSSRLDWGGSRWWECECGYKNVLQKPMENHVCFCRKPLFKEDGDIPF